MSNNQTRSPLKVEDILLDSNSILAGLYKHSLEILKLQEYIRCDIGPPLSNHLFVTNFSHDTLIVHADTPAWASRLRYQTADILNIAKNRFGLSGLESIRIKVKPLDACPPKPASTIRLSLTSSELLRNVAESIDDPGLRSSLLQLSRNN